MSNDVLTRAKRFLEEQEKKKSQLQEYKGSLKTLQSDINTEMEKLKEIGINSVDELNAEIKKLSSELIELMEEL